MGNWAKFTGQAEPVPYLMPVRHYGDIVLISGYKVMVQIRVLETICSPRLALPQILLAVGK